MVSEKIRFSYTILDLEGNYITAINRFWNSPFTAKPYVVGQDIALPDCVLHGNNGGALRRGIIQRIEKECTTGNDFIIYVRFTSREVGRYSSSLDIDREGEDGWLQH